MSKGYTNQSKIESYLEVTISECDVDTYVSAAEKYIDNYTQRNFKADTAATTRRYNGNSRQGLRIDDCVEVTMVELGNDVWGDTFTEITNTPTTRYYLLPTNYSQDEEPINKIGLRDRIWIDGHANHRITAKWGYSVAVPADIAMAATVFASGMYYQNKGENTGAIKSEKICQYQVSYAEEGGFNDLKYSLQVLDSYKLFSL